MKTPLEERKGEIGKEGEKTFWVNGKFSESSHCVSRRVLDRQVIYVTGQSINQYLYHL